MALTAIVGIDRTSYAAGSNPPPQVSVTVSNPTASAVVVTGVQFYFDGPPWDQLPQPSAASMSIATGLGATVVVPALSSLILGPTSLAVGSAAATVSRPQSLNPTTEPSQVQSFVLVVGAWVYASDRSICQALPGLITVLPWQSPQVATYPVGNLAFGYQQNCLIGLVLGVL